MHSLHRASRPPRSQPSGIWNRFAAHVRAQSAALRDALFPATQRQVVFVHADRGGVLSTRYRRRS